VVGVDLTLPRLPGTGGPFKDETIKDEDIFLLRSLQ
jgi:hypothetical protein